MIKLKIPKFIYSSFFSSFKNAVLKKKLQFSCYCNKLVYSICTYLTLKNYFHYTFVHYLIKNQKYGSILTIVINYNKDLSSITKLQNLYKKSRNISFTFKSLQKIWMKQKRLILLSTSRGILDIKDALIYKIGGLALMEFY